MNLVKLLSEHHAHIGPVSGAWTCTCGLVSTNGSIGNDDLTTRNERCAEHDAHLAEVILSALGSDQMRETVARAIDTHGYWRDPEVGGRCPGCEHVYYERRPGAYMDPDLDWLHGAVKNHRATAALAAVVDALRGTP